ncbi:MAG: glycosyltransferase family 4 protein [Anaerolineales bacterium]|nr:glycosyltransferase family 4 protein [Anaerolineales bacterium]
MKIVFFHRKQSEGTFSLEGYFQTVRDFMPTEIKCIVAESTFESRGVIKRIYNTIEAMFRQGDVNHITGDIHYVSYFLRKSKTLLTIHDCVFTQNTAGIKKYILKILWYVIPEQRVSIITVVSQSTKKELLEVVPCNKDKIIVIPDCISPNYIYKEKLFNINKPVILQVGTGANKNLLRLFEAIRGIPCRLHLIGRLSYVHKETLEKYKVEYSNDWNLSMQEMISRYQDCDLVTFVSTYEGFGMPILEANATGRAVVTSNVMSMPEVAGDAACLVNPYEIDSIRDGILRVIYDHNYRNMLVENGRKNIERFKPSMIAMQYVDLYNHLAYKS